MIIAEDWVWLHFPKCAGNTIEKLLRTNLSDNRRIRFDAMDHNNIIWHHSIPDRERADPDFALGDRRVICAIRRLPDWLVSRVHFEASRPPHHLASRQMLEDASFYEQTGVINTAERTLRHFSRPRVDAWIRTEYLVEDLEKTFEISIRQSDIRLNKNRFDYIRDWRFWFSEGQLKRLYELCPTWADTEERVYGSLLI